jgi:hypothetical protein
MSGCRRALDLEQCLDPASGQVEQRLELGAR